MGKIIKVAQTWLDHEVDEFVEALQERDIEAIVVRDDEMEVFEYDELENITVNGQEFREELGIEREIDTEAYYKVE